LPDAGTSHASWAEKPATGMFRVPRVSPAAIAWQAEPVIRPPFWQVMTRSQQASNAPSPPVRCTWQSTPCGPGVPQSTRAESGLVSTVHAASASAAVESAMARMMTGSFMEVAAPEGGRGGARAAGGIGDEIEPEPGLEIALGVPVLDPQRARAFGAAQCRGDRVATDRNVFQVGALHPVVVLQPEHERPAFGAVDQRA